MDRLIAGEHSVVDLHHHRIHLYAASRWRSVGRELPAELRALERGAASMRMALGILAGRVRDAYEGPLVLLKGADVAGLYPAPELRPSEDLDLLVPNAPFVQQRLLENGFVEDDVEVPEHHHHLAPLRLPGLPGSLEIHSTPNWPIWLSPPRAKTFIEAATEESRIGHGVRALRPDHRVLVLLAHLWRDDPIRRIGHLVDVVLATRECDGSEIAELIRLYGLQGLWGTTTEIVTSLLKAETLPRHRHYRTLPLTRHLDQVGQRSVLEARAVEVVAPFYGRRWPAALREAGSTVGAWFVPNRHESWLGKLRRSATLLIRLFDPASTVTREREGRRRRRP